MKTYLQMAKDLYSKYKSWKRLKPIGKDEGLKLRARHATQIMNSKMRQHAQDCQMFLDWINTLDKNASYLNSRTKRYVILGLELQPKIDDLQETLKFYKDKGVIV